MLKNIIHTQGMRISLILLVFLLFLSCAIGVLEINIISGLEISINSQLLQDNPGLSTNLLQTKEFLLFVTIGVVLTILLPLLRPIPASLLTFVVMILPIMLNYYTPVGNPLLPMEYTLLMILMLFIMNVMISYFMEEHTRERIIRMMGHYIPPEIVNKISRGRENINLDGEARTLSVLFCDIRDFSSMAESMKPEEVAGFLNEYFTILSKVLYQYQGTIDKFIGDALMAFWGAPLRNEEHARTSILAAMEMHQKTIEFSKQMQHLGRPPVNAGFGINTGRVSVGNMGSEYRLAYTVIGDAVNIASRVEKLTRVYQVPIIVNEPTMLECDDIVFRELDKVVLKGRHSMSRIYQPLMLREQADDNIMRTLQRHAEGLNAFYNESWQKAETIYSELVERYPDDAYYDFMLERVRTAAG